MHFSSLLVGKYSPQNSCFSYDGEELYLSPEHNAVSYKEGCKFRGVYSKASNQYGWVRKVEPFTIENFLEKLDCSVSQDVYQLQIDMLKSVSNLADGDTVAADYFPRGMPPQMKLVVHKVLFHRDRRK